MWSGEKRWEGVWGVVIIAIHCLSLFFYVFCVFEVVLNGFRGFWKGLGGVGRDWEVWGGVWMGGEGGRLLTSSSLGFVCPSGAPCYCCFCYFFQYFLKFCD